MSNTLRESFFQHVAQTSDSPIGIEVQHAEGCTITSTENKTYLDLISGISVSNLGHNHPKIQEAVIEQVKHHSFVMVYGEYLQTPQTMLAERLTQNLPDTLDNIYFVNSGSEAVEGAMKLVKRFTGRKKIIACRNAYHGGTHGALSLMDHEEHTVPFHPLLPEIEFIEFGNADDLVKIGKETAGVFIEPVQGEAGIRVAEIEYFRQLKKVCHENDALLVFDEIQTGMGRTGSLFYFEQIGVVPDVLLTAKAFGGGYPLGAFISSKEIMSSLSHDPPLGHITTFGGHPVCCAAGLVALDILQSEDWMKQVPEKEARFNSNLQHYAVQEIRSAGLMMALEFESADFNDKVIDFCIANGVITDWFLYADNCMRIAPPITISKQQIDEACEVIMKGIESANS